MLLTGTTRKVLFLSEENLLSCEEKDLLHVETVTRKFSGVQFLEVMFLVLKIFEKNGFRPLLRCCHDLSSERTVLRSSTKPPGLMRRPASYPGIAASMTQHMVGLGLVGIAWGPYENFRQMVGARTTVKAHVLVVRASRMWCSSPCLCTINGVI